MANPVKEYASVDDALANVRAKIRVERGSETIPTRKAYGRVSSEDVESPVDVPALAASHWDGFAVAAGDLEGATDSKPAALKVIGASKPGAPSTRKVRRGEAVRVATGAVMPAGADAVIPVEAARMEGLRLLVTSAPETGSHVYRAGEDVRKGERVLAKGAAIRAQDVGMLLALGLPRVKAWKKPRVSVLATGSELTDADRPKPGKVLNSHAPIILRLCEVLGCVPVDLGIAPDEPKAIAESLRRAIAGSDFVITLGGTSAGRRDLVVQVVSSLGPELVIHGIALDRGRVAGVAVVKGKPVLMLPGPVQGAMSAFVLLGLPIVSLLTGRTESGFDVSCRLGRDWSARKNYSHFRKVVYVKLRPGDDPVAEPLSAETESVKILADADGYVVVPEGVTRMPRGGRVRVRLLPGFSSVW